MRVQLDEEVALLESGKAEERKLKSIPAKYATIIPGLVFVVLGVQIHTYVVNEWTQYRIRTDNFPNMSSVSNFSACTDTTSNHSSDTYDHYKLVQQKSADWIVYYNLALNIPTFLSNLILPSCTDAYGRRFLFILSSLGQMTRCGLLAVVIYFEKSFYYIIGINAFDGLLGSSYSLYAIAYCYVADISGNNNQRVLGTVSIQFIVMATSVLSSGLTGYMVETWNLGYFNTALLSVLVTFIGFFIFAFVVPETLEEKHRRLKESKTSIFKWSYTFFCGDDAESMNVCYILLLLAFAFSELSGTVNRGAIETLYLLGQPFCWGPSKIGVFQMTRHASQGILGLGSVKLFQKLMSNEAISIISCISTTASFFVEAYAMSELMIYMVPVAGIFGFLLSPLICGIMSTITPSNRQGSMFAGLVSIQIISSIVSSFSDNEIYALSMSYMNGFVFLIMAVFGFFDMILLTAFCCVKPYQSLGATHKPKEQHHVVNTAF